MANESDHLAVACRRIAEDCLYTAQTHFAMCAAKSKKAKGWMVLFPSAVASASGLAVAVGAAPWVGAFAAVAGVVSAVSTFLGVEKEATAHEIAGKLLTQLRHEALALCETHASSLSAEEFATQVRALQNRYGAYVASLPLTDDKEFKKAQAKVQAGSFKYDSDRAAVLPPAAPPALADRTPPALPSGATVPSKDA